MTVYGGTENMLVGVLVGVSVSMLKRMRRW